MNKSNILKIVIAGLLLFVVVVATVNYGRNQRAKLATDTVKDNLPTVQEAKPSESNSKPNQQQPKPEPAPATTAPAPSPANASAPAVTAQIPQSSMPATGPADSIIPTIILGTLTGFYLVSRRRLKADK